MSAGLDPELRTAQYMVDLDMVLETSEYLVSQHSSESPLMQGLRHSPLTATGLGTEYSSESTIKQCLGNSALRGFRRRRPNLDSPTSSSCPSDGTRTLQSSPTSIRTWSTETPRTETFSSQATSPATMSQGSISPTSAAPDTSRIVVSCLACSKTFKGSLADARSNLQRHLRSSRRHNNRETGLKCPMPECCDKARMRSDNLSTHLHNMHKISSPEERQAIVQKCKASVERLERNGIS